jgi:hypothetical protein
MNKLFHRLLLFPVCSLALMILLFGLTVPSPVRADVGVQPILPVGSSIDPGEETHIQMAAEVVTMNVRPATVADNDLVKLNPASYGYNFQPVWYPGVAEVEADFTMKNPTGEAVSMTVWFPLAYSLENVSWKLNPDEIVPRIAGFRTAVDGQPVQYAVSEWPNPKGADKPPLPWASFPVTFPPDVETTIHVGYVLPLKPVPKQPVMDLTYVFQTGAGWAGTIGQARLIVNLPYPASEATLAGLPSGAVLAGQEVRWQWQNFEPGAKDDFSVELLRPDRWQELEAARAGVQEDPQNGRAWLDLAAEYQNLSLNILQLSLMRFGPSYLPLGVEAYRKAADLMPEHPVPHAGLGLLTLAQYRNDPDKPPALLHSVFDEYQIARELDARDPSLLKNAGDLRYALAWLEEALFPDNQPTATVDAASLAEFHVTETARVIQDDATATAEAAFTAAAFPTATHTLKPAQTAAQIPTAAGQPAPSTQTPPAETGQAVGRGEILVVIAAAGMLVLIVVGYLVVKRYRSSAGK